MITYKKRNNFLTHSMSYNFTKFNKEAAEIETWLAKELSGIRTSRATPAILDGVMVESYGSKMPIRELAGISVEDPKTLRITPWDQSQAKEIEKAIALSNLGLSVAVDERGVRVIFPDLTSERRASLIKISKQKLEEARVSMRKLRDYTLSDIQRIEKAGGMGEDERFRLKNELQKLVDAANKKLLECAERKEKELIA